MKHVVSESQVAHLWANWTSGAAQQDARKACGNFFFEGDTIYSYRYSAPLARHAARGKNRCVLLTTEKYSVTTTGHMSSVRCAIHDDAVKFYVRNPLASTPSEHKQNFEDFRQRRETALASMRAAKGLKGQHAEEYISLTNQANDYAAFFGLRARLKIKPPVEVELDAAREAGLIHQKRIQARRVTASERYSAQHAASGALRAAELAVARAEYPGKVASWYAGTEAAYPTKPDSGYCTFNSNPTVLRRLSPTTIQTSRGAEIPYNAGRRFFLAIQATILSGKSWHTNGEKMQVGAFDVQSIDVEQKQIRVGCHVIGFEAIFDFAKRENWIGFEVRFMQDKCVLEKIFSTHQTRAECIAECARLNADKLQHHSGYVVHEKWACSQNYEVVPAAPLS